MGYVPFLWGSVVHKAIVNPPGGLWIRTFLHILEQKRDFRTVTNR